MKAIFSRKLSLNRVRAELADVGRQLGYAADEVKEARTFAGRQHAFAAQAKLDGQYLQSVTGQTHTAILSADQHDSRCHLASSRLAAFCAEKGFVHARDNLVQLVVKIMADLEQVNEEAKFGLIAGACLSAIKAADEMGEKLMLGRNSVKPVARPEESGCQFLQGVYGKWCEGSSDNAAPSFGSLALIPLQNAAEGLDTWKVAVLNDVLVGAAKRLTTRGRHTADYRTAISPIEWHEVEKYVRARQSARQQCKTLLRQAEKLKAVMQQLKVEVAKPSACDPIYSLVAMNNMMAADAVVRTIIWSAKFRFKALEATAGLEKPARILMQRMLEAMLYKLP